MIFAPVMIQINSNCSRLDAVKARANELSVQAAGTPAAGPVAETARKVKSDLASVQAQVKTGDAKKAEAALAAAKRDVSAELANAALASQASQGGAGSGGLDVYA